MPRVTNLDDPAAGVVGKPYGIEFPEVFQGSTLMGSSSSYQTVDGSVGMQSQTAFSQLSHLTQFVEDGDTAALPQLQRAVLAVAAMARRSPEVLRQFDEWSSIREWSRFSDPIFSLLADQAASTTSDAHHLLAALSARGNNPAQQQYYLLLAARIHEVDILAPGWRKKTVRLIQERETTLKNVAAYRRKGMSVLEIRAAGSITIANAALAKYPILSEIDREQNLMIVAKEFPQFIADPIQWAKDMHWRNLLQDDGKYKKNIVRALVRSGHPMLNEGVWKLATASRTDPGAFRLLVQFSLEGSSIAKGFLETFTADELCALMDKDPRTEEEVIIMGIVFAFEAATEAIKRRDLEIPQEVIEWLQFVEELALEVHKTRHAWREREAHVAPAKSDTDSTNNGVLIPFERP